MEGVLQRLLWLIVYSKARFPGSIQVSALFKHSLYSVQAAADSTVAIIHPAAAVSSFEGEGSVLDCCSFLFSYNCPSPDNRMLRGKLRILTFPTW